MKKNDLIRMIRTVVREEVCKQLPRVMSEMYIKKIVSEASAGPTRWEDTFDAEMDRQRQSIPEPLDNSDEGIYQGGGVIKRKNETKRMPSLASALGHESNPMREVYEGTRPIPQQGGGHSQHLQQLRAQHQQMGMEEFNPHQQQVIEEGPYRPERMESLSGQQGEPTHQPMSMEANSRQAAGPQAPPTNIPLEMLGDFSKFGDTFKQSTKASNAPMKQTDAAEEKRLEMYRQSLNEKVVR